GRADRRLRLGWNGPAAARRPAGKRGRSGRDRSAPPPAQMTIGSRLAAIAVVVAAASVAAPAGAAPRPLHVGFVEAGTPDGGSPAARAAWLDGLAHLGADRQRIHALWSRIATRAPAPGEDPADPGWPGYDWTSLDA